jgi:hypothetical protein
VMDGKSGLPKLAYDAGVVVHDQSDHAPLL